MFFQLGEPINTYLTITQSITYVLRGGMVLHCIES